MDNISTLHKNHWSLDPEANTDIDESILPKLYTEHFDGLNSILNKNEDLIYISHDQNQPFTSNIIEIDNKILNFKIPRSITRSIRNTDHAQGIQIWRGFVTEIDEKNGFFKAKLYELNDSKTYEYGEFDIKDVDPADHDLFLKGGCFYWTIGHFMINKQVKKQSELRFQRIAPLSVEEYDKIIVRSESLNSKITWD